MVVTPVDGTLVAGAVLSIYVVDVELGLVAACPGADVVLAVIRAILLLMKASLETTFVVEAEVAPWCCKLTATLARLGAEDVLIAMDGLPPIREAHT